MGCDGGTIPRRDELVRTKKKPEQKDKNAENVAKWKHCAISQDPLHKPIVACELGKLYNKEAVLEHLLNKDGVTAEIAGHIKKLSDVKELNLTEKNGFEAKSRKGDEYVDFNDSRYMCPVTGVEMNGRQRFYFIWKCGCVLSERAIKEVKSETCHKCGKPFEENDIIILNGTNEEIEALREKMIERRRLAKLEKKKRKCESSVVHEEKKIKIEPCETSGTSSNSEKILNGGISKEDKMKSKCTSDSSIKVECANSNPGTSSTKQVNGKGAGVKVEAGISKPSTSSTKQVNGKEAGVKVEAGICKPSTSSTKQVNGKEKAVRNGKYVYLPEKAKETYSIAKDPSATEAYKSLFTSHSSAKKQDKAHWVTHNPLYF